MQDKDFGEIVEMICKQDGRYDRRAYYFLRQGLDYTLKELRTRENKAKRKSNHVSGKELLGGLRAFALDQYGPLAKLVLNDWNVRSCSDFGELVFNLIDYNVFSKTDADKRDDFRDLYDFDNAFVKPFQPSRRHRRRRISVEEGASG